MSVRKKISIKSIASAALGSLLDSYDLFTYGAMTATLAAVFFSGMGSAKAQLFSLIVFGLGYAARPIGALIFGHMGDRHGRKKTFLATVLVMGIATILIGLLPGYDKMGVAAPILLVILRLLQGISYGGELCGAFVYAAEHAPVKRRSFYAAWSVLFASVGILLANFIVAMAHDVAGSSFESWGWRIPYLVAVIFMIIALFLRLIMDESPVFEALKAAKQVSPNPLKQIFTRKRYLMQMLIGLFGLVSIGPMLVTLATIMPIIFLNTYYHVPASQIVGLVSISLLVGLPFIVISSWLCDLFGKKIFVYGAGLISAIIFLPAYHGIAHFAPDLVSTSATAVQVETAKQGILWILIVMQVMVAFVFGGFPALIAENFDAAIRYSASSFSYSIGVTFFCGFIPSIVVAINAWSGSSFAGFWYPVISLLIMVVVGVIFVKDKKNQEI